MGSHFTYDISLVCQGIVGGGKRSSLLRRHQSGFHYSMEDCKQCSAHQSSSPLLSSPYLYGMCLLPLTRARITLPRADRERHRGAELGEEFSLLFPPPPPPSTLTSQLPKSSRWRRLRPPDTSKFKDVSNIVEEKQEDGKG